MKNNKIIIIGGPTASGKSGLGIEIAKERPALIINADSMQVYSGVETLAAHPSKAEQEMVPHVLYSIKNYDQSYSAGQFLEDATYQINQARENGLTPIVIGGTGLYLKSLVYGINEMPDISAETRKRSMDLLDEMGNLEFHKFLISKDPTVAHLKENDRQRMSRAYEILLETGKSITYFQSLPPQKFYDLDEFEIIITNPDREKLYENCNLRFDQMLESGALEEVENLLAKNVDETYSISNVLGFKELASYIKGEISLEEAVNLAKQKTRNYAKRQVTWFRHQFQ